MIGLSDVTWGVPGFTGRLLGMIARAITIAALLSVLLAAIAHAESPAGWREQSERTRAAVYHMENSVNLTPTDTAGKRRAYEAYMATFSPTVIVHGLVPSGDVDYAGLRQFYAALFGTFRGSVLVSDEMIVAGNMAAQRYHSLGRMTGQFDGVQLDDRLVALRGQTFFKLDEAGRIAERWSNHDHGYRMALTRGAQGRLEGERLARFLNGPGLTEAEVYERLKAYADAFNAIETPEQRLGNLIALFAPDVRVHGIAPQTVGLVELQAYYQTLWGAMPDLILRHEAMLSTWSMGASRWRATGSARAPYGGHPGDWQPIQMTGEMILRFSGDGQVAEVWIHDHPVTPLEPLKTR